MPKPLVVVTNPIFAETRDLLAAEATLDVNENVEPWPDAELLTRSRNAAGLLAFMTDRVDRAFLAACPRLAVVACALKGWDNFDAAACTAAGVWLTAVPDLLTEPTAELALGLAIALGRNLRTGDAFVRSGRFAGWRTSFYGMGLAGSTIGIAGLGNVGRAIADRVFGFAPLRILGFDARPEVAELRPEVERTGWPQLVRQAQILFLALPLNDTTFHILDENALSNVRRGALIINVGRGSLVDEQAVSRALESGLLGGYATDVYEFEDSTLPDRRNFVHPGLVAEAARTVLTPHIGSAVTCVRREIERAAALNILAVLRGDVPGDAVNTVCGALGARQERAVHATDL